MSEVTLQAKTLKELFNLEDKQTLKIPDYQRSYEWKTFHVRNLLHDTFEASFSNKTYLMGTIILHERDKTEQTYDIVDGQQRLVTLTILMKELTEELTKELTKESPLFIDATFDNIKSIFYIKNTQKEIISFLKGIGSEKKTYFEFLKEKLTFEVLSIPPSKSLDLAYTFFDGINSKGEALSDFDLLKAHHLMFIPERQESLARKHNDYWQSKDAQHGQVFSELLRRIRMWSRGLDRDNKEERNDFYEFMSTVDPKEIEQNEHLFNRYMQPNTFRSWYRENDNIVLNMKYTQQECEDLLPFEIPQTIEGGDSFFLYAKRYHELYELLFVKEITEKSSTLQYANGLSQSIDNPLIQMAFRALVLLYVDKFGEYGLIDIATSIELIISEIRFRWANTRPSPVRKETLLSKVKNEGIVYFVLNSTLTSHIEKLLFDSIAIEDRETHDSPTLKKYKGSLVNFYGEHKSKITSVQLRDKLENIYFANKKGGE